MSRRLNRPLWWCENENSLGSLPQSRESARHRSDLHSAPPPPIERGASGAMPRSRQAWRPCSWVNPQPYSIRPGSTRCGAARGGCSGCCPAPWRLSRGGQHALDHGRRFDGGNDLHFSATGFARLDVNLEHALQTLRPGHGRVASCRALSRAHRVTPSASGRGHLLAQMMVGGEYAVVADEVDARIGDVGRHAGDQIFRVSCPLPCGPACGGSKSRPAIMSNGSNTTCVVPSRYGVYSRWWMSPWAVSERRSLLTAGRVMVRHSRSSLSR